MRIYLAPIRRPRIEMVPLIDTFFLLLAFFISSVLALEIVRGLPVEMPKAGGSKVSSENRLLVTLSSDGSVQLDGEPVTLESLRDRLSGHPSRESLRVGIRADRATRYERVVQVLAAVREAAVARVILLTSPQEGKEAPR